MRLTAEVRPRQNFFFMASLKRVHMGVAGLGYEREERLRCAGEKLKGG